jgi:rRNA biogenesis protein RRP5
MRSEEGEKFNVWVAWLNLENLYGTEDATLALLSRALTHTDARRMYLAALDIFQRTAKAGLAEQCLKAMTRKFSESAEVRREGRGHKVCRGGALPWLA